MAYTKGEMVDQVYLHITGGQPTEDFNVQREDIAIYLANLINKVALIDSRRRRQEAKRDNVGSTGVDSSFLTSVYMNVLFDEEADLSYAKFDKKPLLMDDTYGIAEVGPKQGDKAFVKIKSRYDGVGLDYLFTDTVRWFYEKHGDEQRIYFKGISPVVESVRVLYIIAFDDLGDDDIVPLPSGLEIEVVNEAVNFFAAQAEKPVDNLNNNNDSDRKNAQRQQ